MNTIRPNGVGKRHNLYFEMCVLLLAMVMLFYFVESVCVSGSIGNYFYKNIVSPLENWLNHKLCHGPRGRFNELHKKTGVFL